jgi:hypothetical protein
MASIERMTSERREHLDEYHAASAAFTAIVAPATAPLSAGAQSPLPTGTAAREAADRLTRAIQRLREYDEQHQGE